MILFDESRSCWASTIPFLCGVIVAGTCAFLIWTMIHPGVVGGKPDQLKSFHDASEHFQEHDLGHVESRRTIRALEDIDNDWERALALDNLLASARLEELVTYFSEAQSLSNSAVRRSVQKEILRCITVCDPTSAFEQVETLARFRRAEFLTVILIEWCSYDLEGAVAHARDSERTFKELLFGVIVNWYQDLDAIRLRSIGQELGFGAEVDDILAKVELEYKLLDPRSLWNELINDSKADFDQLSELVLVASIWFQQDGIDVIDVILEDMTRGPARATLLGELLLKVVEYDGAEAFRRITKYYDPTLRLYAERLVRTWTAIDPSSVLIAMTSIQDHKLKRDLLKVVFSTWALLDPISFQELSSFIPQELKDLHEQEVLSLSILQEPRTVAQRLFASDLGGTVEHAHAVVSSWSIKDPLGAFEWTLSNPFIGEWRNELVKQAAASLSNDDIEAAIELSLNQPIDKHSIGFEAIIVDLLTTRDIVLAQSLLSKTRDGLTRLTAYKSVGTTLVAKTEYSGALKIGQDLPEEQQISYYEQITSQLAWTDPLSAFEIFSKTSSHLVKSSIAKQLSVYSRFHGDEVFSKVQLKNIQAHLTESDVEDIAKQTQILEAFDFLVD